MRILRYICFLFLVSVLVIAPSQAEPAPVIFALIEDAVTLSFNPAIVEINDRETPEFIAAITSMLDAQPALATARMHTHTPLHIATIWRMQKTVQILLAHGADVNALNECYQTPLHIAVFAIDVAIIKILLSTQGINVNIQGGIVGNTPLHIATLTGNREVITLLLNAGADRTIQNFSGYTPALLARYLGNDDLADFIEHFVVHS